MNKRQIVIAVQKQVEKMQLGEATGHDWWHTQRVWKLAKEIQKKEGGDLFIVELAAILHDIADWKFSKDDKAGSKKARLMLKKLKADELDIEHVCDIIDNISFKGAGVKNGIETLEGEIVQDADRMDAIGAIGIARAFAYGGSKGREIYNPKEKPKQHKTFGEYKKAGTSINHFYEKLLLLKDKLNTKTAKKLAIVRHKFMETYLKEFFKEWEVKI